MTIKEIAEVAGVSKDTVLRKVKELYPERVKNGVNKTATRRWII